jgi:hypothetical protein
MTVHRLRNVLIGEIASHEKGEKIRCGVTRLQHCVKIPSVFLSRYRGK